MRHPSIAKSEGTFSVRSSCHTLDRQDVFFDDDNAVANGGLCLPMTLAQHLGLRELIDTHVDLGDAAGHANPGFGILSSEIEATPSPGRPRRLRVAGDLVALVTGWAA